MPGYKLSNLDITFISLCKAGKNKKQPILKSENTDVPDWLVDSAKIVKAEKEQRLYCIVCSPGEEFSDGDVVDEVEIKKAMNRYMKSSNTGEGVDLEHNFTALENVYIAESWCIRKNDPLFPKEKPGSWAVGIQIDDPDLWASVEKGEINGVSMGGTGTKIAKAEDFNAVIGVQDLWKYTDALNQAIRSIYQDDEIDNKEEAIDESIDQFRKTIVGNMVEKSQNGIFSGIKGLFKSKKNDKNTEEEMDEKEVKEIVTKALESELPNFESIIAKAFKGIFEPVEKRLETLEKGTNGSAQDENGSLDQQDIEKSHLDSAARIVESVIGGKK